ncbi:TRAP transporter small permease [Marinomonas algarum]
MMALSQFIAEHYPDKGPAKWLAFGLECVTATTLMGLMLLTCADVAGRYFFANSINGAVEITEVLLAVIVFAQMPVITWRGGHVIVDLLDRFYGILLVKVLALFSTLLISAAFYFVAERMIYLASRSLRRGVVTEYLEFPVGYIVQFVAVMSYVCAATMITYGVYRAIKSQQ